LLASVAATTHALLLADLSQACIRSQGLILLRARGRSSLLS
jgi:hypothetical protein